MVNNSFIASVSGVVEYGSVRLTATALSPHPIFGPDAPPSPREIIYTFTLIVRPVNVLVGVAGATAAVAVAGTAVGAAAVGATVLVGVADGMSNGATVAFRVGAAVDTGAGDPAATGVSPADGPLTGVRSNCVLIAGASRVQPPISKTLANRITIANGLRLEPKMLCFNATSMVGRLYTVTHLCSYCSN